MDISQFEMEDSIEFEVILPDGSGSGVFFEIYGQDSEEYKAKERKRINARMLKRGKREKHETIEEIEERNFQTLFSALKNVRGAELDGRELETTEADLKLIFKYMPYSQGQLDSKIVDRVLFMKS